MKIKVFLSIAVFFVLLKSNAQGQSRIGVKGGLSLTNIIAKSFRETENRTGFFIGVYGEIPLTETLIIQPEIIYNNQGNKGNEILSGDIEYRLDYLQVPLVSKIQLFNNLYFNLGPSFNFLVHQEKKIDEYSYDNFAKFFEFGAIAGLSYKIGSDFEFIARYMQGFSQVFNDDFFSVNNQGIQFGMGYSF